MKKNESCSPKSKETKAKKQNIHYNKYSIISKLLEKYKTSKNLRFLDNLNDKTDLRKVA